MATTTHPTVPTVPSVPPFALPPGGGDARWYLGALLEWKARAGATGGAFSLVEVTVQPGTEPPLHVHAHEDEAYIVLNGRITFQVGDERVDAQPGSFVFLPRGVPHGFAVRSEVARAVLLLTPGGLESFFDGWSEPARERTLPPLPDGPPDVAGLTRDLAARGVEVVGPPLPALL